jgi:hypothetical protein
MFLARMSSYSADKGCGCSSTGENGGDVNHVGMLECQFQKEIR